MSEDRSESKGELTVDDIRKAIRLMRSGPSHTEIAAAIWRQIEEDAKRLGVSLTEPKPKEEE